MSTNRFQTLLITGLAITLGATTVLSLNPNDAIGRPAGPNVSVGANPIMAWAGTANSTASTVFTAPSDQNIIITALFFRGYEII